MQSLMWGAADAPLHLVVHQDAPVVIGASSALGDPRDGRAQSLVEIVTTDAGTRFTSSRHRRSTVGERMRYVSHRATDDALVVVQRDAASGLEATTEIHTRAGSGAYRALTSVTNTGASPRRLEAVSSMGLGGLTGHLGDTARTMLRTGRNESFAENRWSAERIDDLLPDINPALHGQPARGLVERTGETTWPTGRHQPAGLLEGPRGALVWEVEHPGPWRWELGSLHEVHDWIGLILMGPTSLQHGWSLTLAPGETFTSVPASFALGEDLEDAVRRLTCHRRAAHGPRPAHATTALIYNDYMNTLMGDPTVERLEPLIDAAADAGADVFCIDAGWYDEGGDWWPSVGRWEPSRTRFGEAGLPGLLERIRSRGMRPGLWLEPEVVGVSSPVADELPDSAFMARGGVRIASHDRHFLDLGDDSARAFLEATLDRVLGEYGAEYVKWDYNVTPGCGPEADGASPGAGLLAHHRGLHDAVRLIRARHPQAMLESCASGAQRQDSATLALFDLQSTSDQQDPRLYPVIAAGAGMAMPLEQAGNWAYPQPDMTVEEVVFTLVTGLAGRMYLSGRLDEMSERSRALVREATGAYRDVIAHHARSAPGWPTGLPSWNDPLISSASIDPADGTTVVCVWSRAEEQQATLMLPHLAGSRLRVEHVFPRPASDLRPWHVSAEGEDGQVRIEGMGAYEARVIKIHRAEP